MSLVGIRPRSAKSWKIYPKRHKKRALKYKPGLISATNAFELKSFNDLLKAEQKYLDDYEKNPWKTQILYLKKIMFNIFFNGLRSR